MVLFVTFLHTCDSMGRGLSFSCMSHFCVTYVQCVGIAMSMQGCKNWHAICFNIKYNKQFGSHHDIVQGHVDIRIGNASRKSISKKEREK